MHGSVSLAPVTQFGPLKLALETAPLVPVIFSAARFASSSVSPVSTNPDALISVNGSGVAIRYVALLGIAPANGNTAAGPPAAELVVPFSGSKLAALCVPHRSPAVQPVLPPETSVS